MSLKQNHVLSYILQKVKLDKSEEYVQASVRNIKDGTDISGAKLWVLSAAIFIACMGLNINSAGVIIGAMLISPFMGPVLGIGLGLGTFDMRLVFKGVRNYMVAVIISIITSSVYFLLSPMKEAGSELFAFTSPTIYDVLIAFLGGLAGIIASSSKLSRSNVIPGVTIATAFMPPLCTVGYGLANHESHIVLGALYMFFINSVFITLATYIIVRLLKYPHAHTDQTRYSKHIKWVIWSLVLLTLIPSIYITFNIVKQYVFEQAAIKFINNEISDDKHQFVISRKLQYDRERSTIELTMLGKDVDSAYKQTLQSKLKQYGLGNTSLILFSADERRSQNNEGAFSNINKGLQLNTGSIQDIYARLDSMQKSLARAQGRDTTFRNITMEAKKQITSLSRFAATPSIVYNYKKNNYDTSWIVQVAFDTIPSQTKMNDFKDWLTNRLRSDDIRIIRQ